MTGTASKDFISAMKIQKISQTPINKGDLKDFMPPENPPENGISYVSSLDSRFSSIIFRNPDYGSDIPIFFHFSPHCIVNIGVSFNVTR